MNGSLEPMNGRGNRAWLNGGERRAVRAQADSGAQCVAYGLTANR